MAKPRSENPRDERYSTLLRYGKFPDDFEMRGYRNLWSIEEHDDVKGSRMSIISSDYNQPINETKFKENK